MAIADLSVDIANSVVDSWRNIGILKQVENESQYRESGRVVPLACGPVDEPMETILATLPGASDDERMVVLLRNTPAEGSQIELCQQTWGEGVGWFNQTSVQLQPHQVAQLRTVLGTGPVARASGSTRLPRSFSRATGPMAAARVIRADSA